MISPGNESLRELADAAFLQAARKVVERARRTGTPVIVCVDGQMKELHPDEVVLPEPAPPKEQSPH